MVFLYLLSVVVSKWSVGVCPEPRPAQTLRGEGRDNGDRVPPKEESSPKFLCLSLGFTEKKKKNKKKEHSVHHSIHIHGSVVILNINVFRNQTSLSYTDIQPYKEISINSTNKRTIHINIHTKTYTHQNIYTSKHIYIKTCIHQNIKTMDKRTSKKNKHTHARKLNHTFMHKTQNSADFFCTSSVSPPPNGLLTTDHLA